MIRPQTLPPLIRGEWRPMPWDDFLVWSPGEGQAEWVDGEGIAYMPTSPRHDELVQFLTTLLGMYVRLFQLGRVYGETVLLRLPSRPAGRMPDLFIIADAAADFVERQWVDLPALLVVEFLSEESATRDLEDTRQEYERDGIPEYLIIDARPGQRFFQLLRLNQDRVYASASGDEFGRVQLRTIPGFWLDPRWFWQDPLPNPMAVLKAISPEAWRRLLDEVDQAPLT
jgi:Uma2 family endonuclease